MPEILDFDTLKRKNPELSERALRLAPGMEVEQIIYEATKQVEDELRLEDVGWTNFSASSSNIVTDQERINNLKLSRIYYVKDPLGRQSIRLWTDYTFGSGMASHASDDKTEEVRASFWDAPENQSVFSARGQRLSSDKCLVDGEIFFAIFLGTSSIPTKMRRIDPLEITEIITDPDDIENVLYYRRQWTDTLNIVHDDYYRSTSNIKGEPAKKSQGTTIQKTQDALIYHLTYNTIGQRGNPLLLPALDWIKQYRRFLASRVAIMLALARFAWHTKVTGGVAAVAGIKTVTDNKEINAASQLIENLGSDTKPIKTESNAKNAYEDSRMIKLQVCAAVGISEQYFGDISTGNLATAKTVELPMMKQFQSYQKVWADTYQDIDEVVFAHNGISPDKMYVDRDFPPIAPADVALAAESMAQILQELPELGDSDEVKQIALMTLGINDPAEVLDLLRKGSQESGNQDVKMIRALKLFREAIVASSNGKGE